jgi:hypothetical protein
MKRAVLLISLGLIFSGCMAKRTVHLEMQVRVLQNNLKDMVSMLDSYKSRINTLIRRVGANQADSQVHRKYTHQLYVLMTGFTKSANKLLAWNAGLGLHHMQMEKEMRKLWDNVRVLRRHLNPKAKRKLDFLNK